MDWRHRAACLDEDPELFFPVGTTGPALRQLAEAKAVCQRCPVRAECLEWALASGQDAGVWGGLSEDERRALKRRNASTGSRPEARPTPKPVTAKPRAGGPWKPGDMCHGRTERHTRTVENTRVGADGKLACRDCDRLRQHTDAAKAKRNAWQQAKRVKIARERAQEAS